MPRSQVVLLCVFGLSALVSSANASGMIVGGVSKDSNTQSEENVRAAHFSLEALNSNHGLLSSSLGSVQGPLKLVTVKEVSSQVVAGMKYYLTLAVQDGSGKTFDIKTEVWSRPWLENSNSGEPAWQLVKASKANESN